MRTIRPSTRTQRQQPQQLRQAPQTGRTATMAAVGALALIAGGVVGATSASGQVDDRPPLLRSGLVGSTPAPAGPTLFGVTPGGAPWVADDSSSVRVDRDGNIILKVRGLVIPIPPFNGTNPVPQLSASLVCNGAVVASTGAVAFDTEGNARLRQTVSVPSTCLAPAVLVHPGTNTAVYIAASG